MKNMLFISFTSISDFRKCPRYYWYRHKEKLEKRTLNMPYFVGKVVHEGIHHLYKKSKAAVKEMLKMYDDLKKKAIGISQTEEQELVEQRYVVEGMVNAYSRRYSVFLKATKLVQNEVPLNMPIGENCTLVGKIDNLLEHKKALILHELKTTKALTPEYVQNIQTDLQSSVYYFAYNATHKNKINKILYDVIRKPSIRKKMNESYNEYLHRLSSWYDDTHSENVFWVEPITTPKIKTEEVMNTLQHIANDISQRETVKDFYQDFGSCFNKYGKCEFYQLCHEGGQSKENMLLYRQRETHEEREQRVNDLNKQLSEDSEKEKKHADFDNDW